VFDVDAAPARVVAEVPLHGGHAMALHGGLLAVAHAQVTLFDVTAPAAPRRLADIAFPSPLDVALDDGFVYVVSEWLAFRLSALPLARLDAAPTIAPLADLPVAVAATGGDVVVSTADGGLYRFRPRPVEGGRVWLPVVQR
jgi:hypothetical protein